MFMVACLCESIPFGFGCIIVPEISNLPLQVHHAKLMLLNILMDAMANTHYLSNFVSLV